MIDIEVPLFNLIYEAVQAEYPECTCFNARPQTLAKFPAVVVVEDDNTTYYRDRGAEKHAEIMYQVDIFCDNQQNAKTLCKSLASIVDSVFISHNFNRLSLSPMPNTDPNIVRYTGRYRAVVSTAINHGTGSDNLPELEYILYRR